MNRRGDVLTPNYPLDTVTVSRSGMDSTVPWHLTCEVSDFVALALQSEYLPAELPPEAIIAHALIRYEGEVNNGGHAQFASHSDGDMRVYAALKDALDHLNLDRHAAIVADLMAFARDEPERAAHCHGQADEIDPHFHALDDRFGRSEADIGHITRHAHDWLVSRPWISAVDDGAYRALHGQLVPPHPMREARRALRRPDVERDVGTWLAAIFRRKH